MKTLIGILLLALSMSVSSQTLKEDFSDLKNLYDAGEYFMALDVIEDVLLYSGTLKKVEYEAIETYMLQIYSKLLSDYETRQHNLFFKYYDKWYVIWENRDCHIKVVEG
jgi:hypothetical protein